ncbi:thyroglobulin-like [Pollicipes pollicipes]|uniref:thyroglobulin-like n=1 Tax=Pollicipes pollicipes TaxID=41117 RepID=UPI001884DD13|nr:thyroglobulin-like [Pollicipes pollicipes]
MQHMDTGGAQLSGLSLPDCDRSGRYRPKQCKGSKCNCVDPEGNTVEGYERNLWDAQDMHCGCVRLKYEVNLSGQAGTRVTCNELGNFHSHQCTGSVCYCVDHLTGERKPGAEDVHVSESERLEQLCAPLGANHRCWDEAQRREASGLVGAAAPACDIYGQYSPKQCQGSQCLCVDPNNKPLEGYTAHVTSATQMHCNCARREWELRRQRLLGRSVRCDRLGNYQPQQCTGSDCYEVDTVTGSRLAAGRSEPLLGADRPCDDAFRRLAGTGRQPKCDRNGRYAARQCHGGACFCAAPDGSQLEQYQSRAEDGATCHCARREFEVQRSHTRGLTVRCDARGDYELRQCLGSQCHCVEAATGQRRHDVAPRHVAELAQLDCRAPGGAGGAGGY